MNRYRHIFFDLDNTLWDFDRNSAESLHELYHKHELNQLGISSLQAFIDCYQQRNAMMWEQYRLGKIDRDTLRAKRFELTFWDMGIEAEEALTARLSHEYLNSAPTKEHLFPDVAHVLEYLSASYRLYIITNGFHDVQQVKLDTTGIRKFFSRVFTSEHTGFRKPDVNIFYYAQETAKAKASECLMVGDGLEVDVAGARNAGWDTVFFNPRKLPHNSPVTYEIESMIGLKEFL